MLINSTVTDVARKFDVTYETVTGILDRWVMTKMNWDEFERIEVVGLDEIAQRARLSGLCSPSNSALSPQRG